MDAYKKLLNVTRRHFLLESALGLGALAMGSMTGSCAGRKQNALKTIDRVLNPMTPQPPHFPGKAKSVIYLHMAGAPSQLELFDYKPELIKLNDQPCPPSLLEGKTFAFIRGVPKMMGAQSKFQQRGDSCAWVSDCLPHFASISDEVSFLKGVHTDQFNHGPAQLFVHTG